jgi:hypothetical protein
MAQDVAPHRFEISLMWRFLCSAFFAADVMSSSSSIAEICLEKKLLLLDYQAATETYSRTVLELSNRVGLTSGEEYLELRNISEEAGRVALDARDRLQRHTAEHGC